MAESEFSPSMTGYSEESISCIRRLIVSECRDDKECDLPGYLPCMELYLEILDIRRIVYSCWLVVYRRSCS